MSKFGGSFRTTQWDPLLLISQIIAIQSLMYFSLGIFSYVLDWIADSNHSLDHLFVDVSKYDNFEAQFHLNL